MYGRSICMLDVYVCIIILSSLSYYNERELHWAQAQRIWIQNYLPELENTAYAAFVLLVVEFKEGYQQIALSVG